MSKTLVILNPISGNGAGTRLWPSIERALREGGLNYDLARTDAADSAFRIAASAKQSGYETIIAVGGDGTIHQVANGLMSASGGEPTGRLGFIPVGSGNDFVKAFGLPSNWRSGVKMVLSGSARWIDVGRVTATESSRETPETHYFVNSCNTGWGARVAFSAHSVPLFHGTAMYLVAVLKELVNYHVPRIRADFGGQVIEQRSTMIAMGNGISVGGAFRMTPEAKLDDGVLDICIAQAFSRIGVIGIIPKLIRGTHLGDPRIYFTRSSCITIDSPDPLVLETDGEIPFISTHHIQVEILPKRLLVLA